MSDRILIMDQGIVQQVGAPTEIRENQQTILSVNLFANPIN